MSSRPDLYSDLRVRFRVPLIIIIPVTALLVIAAVTIGFSRVLLAIPAEAAVVVALVTAINVLGACAVIATRRLSGIQMAELAAVVLYPVVIGIAIAQFGLGTEESAEAEQPSATGAGGTELAASGVAFDIDRLTLPAREEVTVTLDNQDSVPHNFAMYETEAATEEIFVGETFTGPDTMEYSFRSPKPGEYFFQCDVHPDQMNGTVVVE
jgi:plastocyanin